MKTYISGPMTGKPDLNRQAFINKGAELALLGHDVVNPIANGVPVDATRAEHMRADLRMLLECDTIHMLPGWLDSRGARLEWWVAVSLGFEVEGAEA